MKLPVPLRHTILSVLILGLGAVAAHGSYYLSKYPESFTVSKSLEAFNPDNPGEKLGDFPTGAFLKVLEPRMETGHWLVEWVRYDRANVKSLVAAPSLATLAPAKVEAAQAALKEFPLLRRLMEAKTPWPHDMEGMKKVMLSDNGPKADTEGEEVEEGDEEEDEGEEVRSELRKRKVAGIDPAFAAIIPRDEQNVKIIVELWNRDQRRAEPNVGSIMKKLESLEKHFGSRPDHKETFRSWDVKALTMKRYRYFLPNFIMATVRHNPGDFLLIEYEEFKPSGGEKFTLNNYNSYLFEKKLKESVKQKEGCMYIDGIPMINQAEKGYCVPATFARVLNYYGHETDMYELGVLAQATARNGTTTESFVGALMALEDSPFTSRLVESQQDFETVLGAGVPVIQLLSIPGAGGHCRLIIGMDPDFDRIVYSDSYGPGHGFRTMSTEQFFSETVACIVLEPEGNGTSRGMTEEIRRKKFGR